MDGRSVALELPLLVGTPLAREVVVHLGPAFGDVGGDRRPVGRLLATPFLAPGVGVPVVPLARMCRLGMALPGAREIDAAHCPTAGADGG